MLLFPGAPASGSSGGGGGGGAPAASAADAAGAAKARAEFLALYELWRLLQSKPAHKMCVFDLAPVLGAVPRFRSSFDWVPADFFLSADGKVLQLEPAVRRGAREQEEGECTGALNIFAACEAQHAS